MSNRFSGVNEVEIVPPKESVNIVQVERQGKGSTMLARGRFAPAGAVSAKLIKNGTKAPILWKLKNNLRWRFIWNRFTFNLAFKFTKLTGILTTVGSLQAKVWHADGTYTDYGVVAHGLVTDAFVADMVDELQAGTTFGLYSYHESGTGVVAADNNDIDIGTPAGPARVSGTQIEGASAWIFKSVATIVYTGTLAITEHGFFNHLTAGTMMDRHVFAAINVDNTDQIEFTYELTCTAEV